MHQENKKQKQQPSSQEQDSGALSARRTKEDDKEDISTPFKKKVSPGKSKGKENKGKKKTQEPVEDKEKKTGKKEVKKGPYVHIEGDFRSPRVVCVVNSEGAENKSRGKRGIHDSEHKAKSASLGHTSITRQTQTLTNYKLNFFLERGNIMS